MKTIIVATDYSDTANTALRYAAMLARFSKAKIVLLNIYSFNIHALNGLISPAAMDQMLEQNQQQLEKYSQKVSEKFQIALSAYTRTSAEEDSLELFAKQMGAGLIVMGARRNPDAASLSGNVSTAIIKSSRIPVLVIPDGLSFKWPERLLYACDYQSLPGHLDHLKELAQLFGAEIQIFHVSQSLEVAHDPKMKEAVIEKIENTVGTLKHTYYNTNAKDTIAGIKQGIDDCKADILVMSPHKYGFWSSLFHKSSTREMVLQSPVPVLSLPSAPVKYEIKN